MSIVFFKSVFSPKITREHIQKCVHECSCIPIYDFFSLCVHQKAQGRKNRRYEAVLCFKPKRSNLWEALRHLQAVPGSCDVYEYLTLSRAVVFPGHFRCYLPTQGRKSCIRDLHRKNNTDVGLTEWSMCAVILFYFYSKWCTKGKILNKCHFLSCFSLRFFCVDGL